MSKIKVLIADDQYILVEGLAMLLNMEDDMNVIGNVSNGFEVMEFLQDNEYPDLILMDVRMPGMNGVDCTKEVKNRYPEIKVLILTTFDDDAFIVDALKNGADGYMLKDLSAEKLTNAVRNVYYGNTVMHHIVARKIVEGMKSKGEVSVAKKCIIRDLRGQRLLEREEDVLYLLCKGYKNSEIAEKLFLSEGTVKNYVSILYEKFNIKGRTKLMSYAIDLGVLEDERL